LRFFPHPLFRIHPVVDLCISFSAGEYAERIDNADELLESFLDGFHDEDSQVQLQILTAVVKLFLKRPTDTQDLVQQVMLLPNHH